MKKIFSGLILLLFLSCNLFNNDKENKKIDEPAKPESLVLSYDATNDQLIATWDSVTNAQSYSIQYLQNSTDDQWTNLAVNIKTNKTAFRLPHQLESDYYKSLTSTSNKSILGYFKVRVKSINSAGASDWSDQASFQVNASISKTKFEYIKIADNKYKALVTIKNNGNIGIDSIYMGLSIATSSGSIFKIYKADTVIKPNDSTIIETEILTSATAPTFEYCYLGFLIK